MTASSFTKIEVEKALLSGPNQTYLTENEIRYQLFIRVQGPIRYLVQHRNGCKKCQCNLKEYICFVHFIRRFLVV